MTIREWFRNLLTGTEKVGRESNPESDNYELNVRVEQVTITAGDSEQENE